PVGQRHRGAPVCGHAGRWTCLRRRPSVRPRALSVARPRSHPVRMAQLCSDHTRFAWLGCAPRAHVGGVARLCFGSTPPFAWPRLCFGSSPPLVWRGCASGAHLRSCGVAVRSRIPFAEVLRIGGAHLDRTKLSAVGRDPGTRRWRVVSVLLCPCCARPGHSSIRCCKRPAVTEAVTAALVAAPESCHPRWSVHPGDLRQPGLSEFSWPCILIHM